MTATNLIPDPADAPASVADLSALVPPDVAPLLAVRRWAEALAITERRVADSADARQWHAYGVALLGLRRFAEGGAALDHAGRLAAIDNGAAPIAAYERAMDAYALAARGQGEAAIRRLAFHRANRVPVSDGLLAAMAVRAPSRARLSRTAEELLLVALTLGHDDIAASLAAGWEAVVPGNVTARFMLAATAGAEVPSAAPADYLREHFDEFAPGFEATLVGQLGYGTPQVMRDALEGWMRAQPAPLQILDAGCGTGLSGPFFRPFAARLVGVDIAPRMLDVAAEKKCYDVLQADEITAFLRAAAAGTAYDLVIATDVVMYFGEIAPLLDAVRAVLRRGGRFGFTVEAHDREGHRLYPTGRYKHERGWVEAEVTRAGLVVTAVEPTTIRMEGGEPVAGWLFVTERDLSA